MVKIRWTDKAPDALNDIEDAEEMGAKWEGDELVTYDFEGFLEQFAYYESNDLHDRQRLTHSPRL